MTRLAAVAMVGVLVGCSPQPKQAEEPLLIRYPPSLEGVDPRYYDAALEEIDEWWSDKNWVWYDEEGSPAWLSRHRRCLESGRCKQIEFEHEEGGGDE